MNRYCFIKSFPSLRDNNWDCNLASQLWFHGILDECIESICSLSSVCLSSSSVESLWLTWRSQPPFLVKVAAQYGHCTPKAPMNECFYFTWRSQCHLCVNVFGAVWTLHSLFLCTRWLRILYWWSHRSFRWTVPLYRDSVWFVQDQTIFHVSMKFSMVSNQNAALWTMLHSCSLFTSSVQNVTFWLSKVKFIFRSNNKCSLGIWTSLNINICFSLQWHHWFRCELGLFRQTIVFHPITSFVYRLNLLLCLKYAASAEILHSFPDPSLVRVRVNMLIDPSPKGLGFGIMTWG